MRLAALRTTAMLLGAAGCGEPADPGAFPPIAINFRRAMRDLGKLHLAHQDAKLGVSADEDPWGTKVQFDDSDSACTVRSAGADRVWGTDDDLSVTVVR